MSTSTWRAQLAAFLTPARASDPRPTLAVIGIGQELRGDDFAGAALARRLAARAGLLVIDAGPAPENFTAPLRRFAPGRILLVDAAQIGAPAGALRWLRPEDAAGVSAFTHALPLSVFTEYLRAELGCPAAILGIQPAGNALDAPLSPPVARAVGRLAAAIAGHFPAAG